MSCLHRLCYLATSLSDAGVSVGTYLEVRAPSKERGIVGICKRKPPFLSGSTRLYKSTTLPFEDVVLLINSMYELIAWFTKKKKLNS